MRNKKAVLKRGVVTVFGLAAMLVLLLLIMPRLNSLSIKEYKIGERIKISLERGEYQVRIVTPSHVLTQKVTSSFAYSPEELGLYQIIISGDKSKKMEFKVISNDAKQEKLEELPEFKKSEKDGENNYAKIVAGKPVKNVRKISLSGGKKSLSVSVPRVARNISVFSNNKTLKFKEKIPIKSRILGIFTENVNKTVLIDKAEGEIEIEFETPAPKKEEFLISDSKKEVRIEAPDYLGYKDVLASAKPPVKVKKEEEYKIRIFWKEEGIFVPFKSFDEDNDSLIDRVEWIVPHLSSQTFEIIIISRAEHLDKNRKLIRDVYRELKYRDGIYARINDGEFLRVKFEKNLTSANDITIYARSNSSGKIEVYEKNSKKLIAVFENISKSAYYKIFLKNLEGSQDVFDLKVKGVVEFDYVVDPTFTIHSTGWESGAAGWIDGGADSDRSNVRSRCDDSLSQGGSWSWHLQDNSATSFTSQNFSFSGYDYVDVNFSAYYVSIEGTEALEAKCDGTILFHYEANTQGTENQWLDNVSGNQTFRIYPQNCTFDSSVEVRFEAEFSGNGDDVYIDCLKIEGFTNNVITIIQPKNETYGTTTLDFNISTFAPMDSCWYSLNSTANKTMTKVNSTYFSRTETNLPQGQHNVIFYCNDSSSTEYPSNKTFFTIDPSPLKVNLVSPKYQLYNTTNIDINASLNKAATSCKYSLDGGSNVSMDKINSSFFSKTASVDEGGHEVVVTCSATGLSDAQNSTNFSVDTPTYEVIAEWGSVTDLQEGSWKSVLFKNVFDETPVVIHQVNYSYNYDNNPCMTRIRNVNKTGFQIRAESWSPNNNCPSTGVNAFWIAAKKGINYVANAGTVVRTFEAQNFTMSASACGSGANPAKWDYAENHRFFNYSWSAQPLVLASVQSANDLDVINTYIKGCALGNTNTWNTTCVQIGLNGMENDGSIQPCNLHTLDEEGAFIAWEMNSNWSNSETRDNSGKSGNGVTSYGWEAYWESDSVRGSQNDPYPMGSYFITLSQSFASGVAFGSGIRIDGGNGILSALAYSAGSNQVFFLAEEDEYGDTEQSHTTEPWQALFFNSSSGFLYSNVSIPTLRVLSPLNKTYGTSSIDFNATMQIPADSCKYSLDGGSNVTLGKVNSTFFSSTNTVSDGFHNVTFYCNDTFGNNYSSSATYFSVDSTPFTVKIESPLNASYSKSSVDINASLSKDGQSCVYSLDGGENKSMSKFNSTFFTAKETYIREGQRNVQVYCTDTIGTNANNSTSFSVNINATLNVTRGAASISSGASEINVSVNISDVSKAFVVFSARSSSSGPSQIQAIATLYEDKINFKRYSTTGTLNIEYELIESPNLYVQRGTKNYTSSDSLLNVKTRSINLSESFVLISNRLNTGTASANVRGFWTARLSNSSNIVLERGTTGSDGEIDWQLIEWDKASVQSGTENSVGTSRTRVLGSSVNLNRSFIAMSRRLSGTTSLQTTSVGAYFLNSSAISFYRNNGAGTLDIDWFVVEASEFTVQSGFTTVSGSSPVDQQINQVNLSRAFTLSTYASTGGGTTYANNLFTRRLFNETDIRFQKGTGSQTQNVSWFVIEAGTPVTQFINIIQPKEGSFHNSTSLYFNVSTISAADSCWYSLDGGSNVTMTSLNSTYYYRLQSGLSEAQHSVIFYCNDSLSKVYSSQNASFYIDLTPPSPVQITPANASTNTSNTIEFTYNVTDNFGVSSCSLYSNGVFRWIDYSPSNSSTNSFEAYMPNGVHEWYLECVDKAGNSNLSSNRTLTINGPPYISWTPTWYETSTSSFTDVTANIKLNNTRDSTENQVSYSVLPSSLASITIAKSPFLANKGAIIPGSTTVTFSGFMSATASNVAYITWKAYVENSSGTTLICQSGDDLTGGTRISSASGTWTNTCTSPSSDLVLKESDRLRLLVNIYNAGGSSVTITHIWDNLRLSYLSFNNFNIIGSLFANLTFPSTEQKINVGEDLIVTCDVNCSVGTCYGTKMYVQYNTTTEGWKNISSSGNIILGPSETNPHTLGDVTSYNQTNFTIRGNAGSKENYVRCKAIGTYDSNHTGFLKVNVSAFPQIYFSNPTPANGSSILNNSFKINISINDTSLEEFIFNFNGTNYSFLKDKLDFIYSGPSTLDVINSSNFSFGGQMPLYPSDKNLSLAWTFNNDSNFIGSQTKVVDFAGYDDNGTINGASYNSSGKYGSAIYFNGTSFVRAQGFSGLNGRSQATISAWVKQDSNSQNQYLLWADQNVLIQFGDTIANPGATNLRVRWNLGGAWRNSHSVTGVLDSGKWHNWIIVFNNGNTSIYKDGISIYNGTDTQTSITSSNADYDLGFRTGQGGLNGSVDEFLIWNRALLPEEITAIGKSDLIKNSSNPWEYFVNVKDLPDGVYTFYGYAKNKDGNSNRTETRQVTINTTSTSPPVITIISPKENGYYNTSSIDFNVSLDRAGDWCGYSLDGAANVTMTKINSTYFAKTSSVSNAAHSVIFYCNSTFGIMGSSQARAFEVDAAAPSLSFVSPTPADNATLTVNYTQINVTISENNLKELKLNFNNSNSTFYDSSLVLMMNLNNNSQIGENETYAVDSSIYQNNGTFKGNVSWNSSGKYSYAAEFDGTDDWIQVPDNSSLEGMAELTVEAWVYDTANDGQPRGIVSKRINPSTTSFAVFMYTNRYIYFDIASSSDRNDSGTAIPANQWTHIAVTFNGSAPSSQRKKFYINGKLVRTVASSQASVPDTASNLTIGILNANYGNSWKGMIDEVRVYNKTLQDLDILRHYQSDFKKVSSSQWVLFSNITNLEDGDYNYSAHALDKGFFEGSTERRLVKIAAAAIPPRINLNLPANQTVSQSADVNFNFTVIDSIDSNLTCNLTVGPKEDNGFSVQNNTLTNRLIQNIPDGVFLWNVSCINSANAKNTSESRQIEIREKPTIFLNTSNATWFNGEVQITYTPVDNSNFSSCSLYLDGAFNKSNSSVVQNNAANDFFLFDVSEGLHSYYINCTDTYGLVNVSQTRYFYQDISPPSISLSAPSPGEQIYKANVTFNWTPTDNLAQSFFCNLTLDGSVIDANIPVSNNTLVSRQNKTSSGVHFWNVTCVDNATNSFTSETRNFTSFLPPDVTLDQPENATWLNYSNVTFIYNVFDDDDNIANCSIYFDGVLNQTNSTTIKNGELNNFTINNINQGKHNWTVECIDYTNLTGTDLTRDVYIDTEKPTINLLAPADLEVLTWNNITFNWTQADNLAENLSCDLVIDNFKEISSIPSPNNTVITKYLVKSDGNYTWYVNCTDLANNTQKSPTRNFTVEAPPIVILEDPPNASYSNQTSYTFSYTPKDAIGITSCSLILDGSVNQTDNTITKNQQNSFDPVTGISEGKHNWTVNCTDSDSNTAQPDEFIFFRDLSPPVITLNSPPNNTGVDANEADVYFNWTATDELDIVLTCDLIVDGEVKINDYLVTSGVSVNRPVSGISTGKHLWNVTCWDTVGNINTSLTYEFNRTYPDFDVNSSRIYFNTTSPQESETVKITASVKNLGGVNASSVIIAFYDGDPDSGGEQIGSNQTINISAYSSSNASVDWVADIGPSDIYVIADPPLSSNGSFQEHSEANNKANKSIIIGSWSFFYGDIKTDSKFRLQDNASSELISWTKSDLNNVNLYVADYDATIEWTNLQALGRNSTGLNSSSDFQELDSLLNMTGFPDSVSAIYLNGTSVNETSSYLIFSKIIQNVPIATSINSSNFKTGILWDMSDDSNGEFDSSEKEDVIFITNVSQDTQGSYGITDYEIRVPANLRYYRTQDQLSAAFYTEIL